MNPELKIQVQGSDVTLRTGEALEVKPPIQVRINGTIESPANWLEKKKTEFDHLASHVLVDRDKMTIELVTHETDPYGSRIKGAITMSPEFTKWGINDQSVEYHSNELAAKIKMSRYQFASLTKAAELVTVFQNLKARVQKEVESMNDGRGNAKVSYTQAVLSMSIPDKFSLITPVFKGDSPREIQVEIIIDPESLKCSLISPEAIDVVARERDRLLQEQVARITEAAPEIAIIEI